MELGAQGLSTRPSAARTFASRKVFGTSSFVLLNMSEELHLPPLLSTPAEHVFEDESLVDLTDSVRGPRSSEKIYITYEIERTIAEVRNGKWSRIALQFADEMLPDAPKVFEFLRTGLNSLSSDASNKRELPEHDLTTGACSIDLKTRGETEVKPYILADTSYGACCVDEIAGEHVGADVVVHYGRSCLSPTARLPVIYVFTEQFLATDEVIRAFTGTYTDRDCKIILMADIPYASHVSRIGEALKSRGYTHVFSTDVVHNPSSLLPNRTVPPEVETDPANLSEWDLFHIAEPPEALLLTLSSRVSRIRIFSASEQTSGRPNKPLPVSTARALSRRYALLTSVSTVPIIGILVNTLSVKNYIHIVEHVKAQILAAGKKSYTFVVGKINAAKVANFSEVGAWVVIGCWESSLVESKDFWKPVLTPFELELALKRDDERLWTGKWSSNFQEVLIAAEQNGGGTNDSSDGIGTAAANGTHVQETNNSIDEEAGDIDSEEELAPPEFDLRTGRYVSHSRPMHPSRAAANRMNPNGGRAKGAENALIKRAKGDLAVIGGEASPGAEFLRSKRTWKGLGSDFEIAYEESDQAAGAAIEEGRSGTARGYVHGNGAAKT